MLYLGIDQHARQLTVSLCDQHGDVLLARQVSTRPPKVLEFFDQLTQRCAATGEEFIDAVCHDILKIAVRMFDLPAPSRCPSSLPPIRGTRQNCRMSTITRTHRRYDHRFREFVRETRDIDLAVQHGVPRSTVYGWLNKSPDDVITLDALDLDAIQLQHEVVALRRRNAKLIALLRLIVTVLKVTGFSLSRVRIPEESAKRQLLRAIEQSREHFILRTVLQLIGLTYARFYAWNREECELDDVSSCPKSSL